MKLIPLTQGLFAMVDDELFEELNKFKWYALKVGRRFYAVRNTPGPKRRLILMHRVVMGDPPGFEVDHVDGNSLNNMRAKLRVVDKSGQQRGFQSKRLGCSSEFRGVSWDKRRGKWRAHITPDGRFCFLGYFTVENEKAAAEAFDAKARELGWPEQGLNFPII